MAPPFQDPKDLLDSQDSQVLLVVLVPKVTEDFQEPQAVLDLLEPLDLKVLQDSQVRRETQVMLSQSAE